MTYPWEVRQELATVSRTPKERLQQEVRSANHQRKRQEETREDAQAKIGKRPT